MYFCITERLVSSLAILNSKCEKESLISIGFIQKWLKSSRYQLWKNEDDSVDFKVTINAINKLLGTLKEEL